MAAEFPDSLVEDSGRATQGFRLRRTGAQTEGIESVDNLVYYNAQYGNYVVLVGLALALVGYLWLMGRAFGVRWFWGLALVPGLVAAGAGVGSVIALREGQEFWRWVAIGLGIFAVLMLFAFLRRHGKRAKAPRLVLALAFLLIAAPIAISKVAEYYVDLGPLEQWVDAPDGTKELHVTLTGWDRDDYNVLLTRPETVVVRMANPDVTDETLKVLEGMPQVRELDLNDTKVTDAGLAIIAKMPKLQTLRLARTAITDDGFRNYLAPMESLRQIDLSGTKGVKSSTLRDWKNARPDDRKYMR